MSVLLVASSEPRVGRSLVAAALAHRMARAGLHVTLVRLTGDDSAAADATTFATLEGIVSPGSSLTPADAAAITGRVIAEAPSGSVSALAPALDARVVNVGLAGSSATDAPAAQIAGTILTHVPAADMAVVGKRSGVLAALPEDRVLAAPSVDDIAGALAAKRLAGEDGVGSIERVMIGTVASDAATPYFAQRERICVVTRYDKTDIQLAALQTDLACMVLTGGGEPSPYLLDRVRGSGDDVSVLLAPNGTVESMRVIESLFAASRFDGGAKLVRAVAMLDDAGVPVEV